MANKEIRRGKGDCILGKVAYWLELRKSNRVL